MMLNEKSDEVFDGNLTKAVRDELYKAMDTAQEVFDYMRYGRVFPTKDSTERYSELRGIESILRDVIDKTDQCRQQLCTLQKSNFILGTIQIIAIILLFALILVIHFWG